MAHINNIQCDICGETYEGYRAETWNTVWNSKVTIDDFGTHSCMSEHNRQEYDLCIKCMTRVKNFMNHMKESVETEPMDYKPCKRKCFMRSF